MECIYDKVWLEILLFKTFSLKNVNLQQLRNIVSSQIIERNSRNVQQLMYASPTNFLLQSVDTTRDAKQGKPFPESLKCIEDKASSSQLKPTSKEDIRFIHLIYIFYLPYRKSRIFFDRYVNYSRIINVIRYEVHRIPRKFACNISMMKTILHFDYVLALPKQRIFITEFSRVTQSCKCIL